MPLSELRAVLARGGVLVVPTESSYALAVDPRNHRGVQAVYAIKGRQKDKPLPVVISSLDQLAELGIDRQSPEIVAAERFWPAALSVIVPLAAPLAASAGAKALAVRIPEHGALRSLIAELGPLTATSANVAGQVPSLSADRADELVADVDAIVIDGGELPGGPPSTLVVWEGGRPKVLRPGRFTVDLPLDDSVGAIRAPGAGEKGFNADGAPKQEIRRSAMETIPR